MVKKVDTIDSNKQNLKKKDWRCWKKKIPDTNIFMVSQDFNKLTKINFDARLAKPQKNLKTKKTSRNLKDPRYVSITWLAPRVEIKK